MELVKDDDRGLHPRPLTQLRPDEIQALYRPSAVKARPDATEYNRTKPAGQSKPAVQPTLARARLREVRHHVAGSSVRRVVSALVPSDTEIVFI